MEPDPMLSDNQPSLSERAMLHQRIKDLEQQVEQLQADNDRLHVVADSTVYQTIVESSLQGLAIIQDQRIVFINAAATRMLGYTTAEFLAMSPAETAAFIHPEDRAMVVTRGIQRQSGHDVPQQYAFRCIHKDGSIRWIEAFSTLISYQGRAAVHMAFIDITERKRIEAALDENQHFIQQVASTIPGILYVYDLIEQRNIYSNNQISDILGYTAAEIQALGSEFLPALLHPDDHASYAQHRAAQSGMADNAISAFTYRIRHADGTWRWLLSREVVFKRTAAGQVQQILGVAYDITERIQLETALRESQALLQSVIDHSPVVLVVKDRQGRYLLTNQRAAANLHLDRDQIIGMSEYDLFPSEFADPLLASDRRVWETAQTVEVEDTVPLNGEMHTFLSIKFPLYNAQGEIYAIGAIATDITDRKRAQAELQHQRQFLRRVIDSTPDVIFARDRSGHFTLVNQALADMYGTTVEDLLGKTDDDLHLDAAEVTQLRAEDQQVMSSGNDLHIPERRVQDARGHWRYFTIIKRPLFITHAADQVLVIATDITERKRAEDALRENHAHLQAIFDNAAVGIFTMTPAGHWVDINRRGMRMLGYTLDELTRLTYLDVIHPDDRTIDQHPFQFLHEGTQQSYRIERRYLRKDGTVFWGDLSLTAIYNDQGQVKTILGVLVNITRRKEAEAALEQAVEQLRQQSIRDPLTGLFNRRYLDETLPRELQRAVRQQYPVGVMMLDIDYFKQCNDTYGHDAGDTLLRAVGVFLQSYTRGSDIACRYGGEEFMLIMPGATLADTRQRAEQIRQGIKQLAVHHHGELLRTVTVSLGVAVFPDHGHTSDVLIKVADRLLYQAKHAGRDRVVAAG